MVFQYVHDPQATEVERKLDEVRSSKDVSFVADTINSCIAVPEKKRLPDTLEPNKDFLEAHKKRQEKLHQQKQREETLKSIDEEGFKLEKVYNEESFINFHDPLGIYRSKRNFKDLAWRVYNDVEETQSFLKTLYYPEIRSEDYNSLIGLFSNEHRKLGFKKKLNGFVALGGLGSGYVIGNMLRFKARTTVFLSLGAFAGTFCFLNTLLTRNMNKRLNKKAVEISKKYPEIKLTNIEYGKVNI